MRSNLFLKSYVKGKFYIFIFLSILFCFIFIESNLILEYIQLNVHFIPNSSTYLKGLNNPIKLLILKLVPFLLFVCVILIDIFLSKIYGKSAFEILKLYNRFAFLALKSNVLVFIIALFFNFLIAFIIPIHYDEIWTYLYFSSNNFLTCVVYYPAPNNHIANSLLTCLSTKIFGLGLLSIRLFPIIFSSILMTIIYFICKTEYFKSKFDSILFLLIFVLMPGNTLYFFQSRGYFIQIFSSFCLTYILSKVYYSSTRELRAIDYLAVFFFSVIGFYAIPTFIYFFTIYSIFLFYLVLSRNFNTKSFVVLASLLICIVSFVGSLYIPVILVSGIDSLIHNKFVISLNFNEFIYKYPSHLLETLNFLFGKFGLYFTFLLLVCLVWALIKNYKLSSLLVILSLLAMLPFLLIIPQKAIPFARTWVFIGAQFWFFLVIFYTGFKSSLYKRLLLSIIVVYFAISSYIQLNEFRKLTEKNKRIYSQLIKKKLNGPLIIYDDLVYHYVKYYQLKEGLYFPILPGTFAFKKQAGNYNVLVPSGINFPNKNKGKLELEFNNQFLFSFYKQQKLP